MTHPSDQMSLLDTIGADAPAAETPESGTTAKKSTAAKRARAAPPRPGPIPDAAPDHLPALDQFLCFSLYSANHAMHRVYKPLLQEIGLTYPQYLAMAVLWEKDNVPVNVLTDRLQLETNTVTPLLKRLESMELLTRTRSQKDERQVKVRLTRKGKTLRQKCAHFAGCVTAATGLEIEEIIDLQKRIIRLRDQMRNGSN